MQPEITINYLAVIVCVIASMPVGYLLVRTPVRKGLGSAHGHGGYGEPRGWRYGRARVDWRLSGSANPLRGG